MNFWNYFFDAVIVLFFVFLNGFFVAAEFAIVKVRLTQLEPLAKRGNWRARIATSLVTHLNTYLSATQLGITMASLALGWVGEPLVARHLMPLFQAVGISSAGTIQAISFALAFTIITFLHIILGELAPKSLAIFEPQKVTLFVSYPLHLFYVVFRPIIWALNEGANSILRIFGFQTPSESNFEHSEEELRIILAQDQKSSQISRAILLNALDFHQKQARHAMVPRNKIVAIPITMPASEAIAFIRAQKYSRIPVFDGSIDNIIGIIYIKDIFKTDRHHQPGFTLQSILREPVFLPEIASLEQVLKTILQKKIHMVILVDEYGGTAGLITLENVIEELVGSIQDEYDRETPEMVKINENEYLVQGTCTTNDVERLFDVELSPQDIRSIGGYLTEQLGHFPHEGETYSMNGLKFKVESILENTVKTVRITRLPSTPQDVQ
ncbi:MAG: HlyC/CorC family transporter [Bacteroidetes bacterium]|nr:HlyC/CorC family transporter [Bacteroidota bacterium]